MIEKKKQQQQKKKTPKLGPIIIQTFLSKLE